MEVSLAVGTSSSQWRLDRRAIELQLINAEFRQVACRLPLIVARTHTTLPDVCDEVTVSSYPSGPTSVNQR